MVITLPFSPYRIQVALGKRLYTVNLSPNSPDMRGSYFGRSPQFRAILVSRAKQEMRDTAYVLTRDALSRTVPKEPKLLDLYCGAGGAAMGYHRAGFKDIMGVDNRPQPRYPFKFVQADALEYLAAHGQEYDAIHASPPCQWGIWAAARWRNSGREYPDLVEATRRLLQGSLYIIEQPNRNALVNPKRLCGSSFGLRVIRHRFFETSFPVPILACKGCRNAIKEGRAYTVAGHGGNSHGYRLPDLWAAMGIDWMTRNELTQAIPPAYTEFIGKSLMKEVLGRTRMPVAAPLSVRLSCTIRTRTRVAKDDDSATGGLKWARDGIAHALLGRPDDSIFRWGSVEFESGEPEQTVIGIENM